MKKQKTAFVICSVRNATKEEKRFAEGYVADLEARGYEVHWPPRDTNQKDPVGLRICADNRKAVAEADEIHVIWKRNDLNHWQKFVAWLLRRNKKSEGSYFDFGMSFMAQLFLPDKKIVLANPDVVIETQGKSFENVLHALNKQWSAN